MSVGDHLARLLFIVPYVAHRDGVPLKELAERLETPPRRLLKDIELLSMVGQPPLTPDHLVDLYVEDDVVYVELDQSLSRPLRLTHEEARALALAAKLMGGQGGRGEQLEQIVERILDHLNPVDADAIRALGQRIELARESEVPDDEGGRLRSAVDERIEVELSYYSVSSDRTKAYRLRPLALITHTGVDYLVAQDVGAALQEKLFRIDRMSEVKRTDTVFDAPEDLDLERFRRPTPYLGADDLSAKVVFGPEVARQVRERFADRQIETVEGGGVRVSLSTSSPAWLARWVLPFGPAAEVVAPPMSRQAVAKICQKAAELYSDVG